MSSSNQQQNQDPYNTEFVPDLGDLNDQDLEESAMRVIDTQSLDADDFLGSSAAENAPKTTDDTYPRWAMSGLLPIPLFQQNGNNSFGDFNKKDEHGRNIVNHSWYPPFRVMPLFGGTFNIPHENSLTELDEEPRPEPFNYGDFMKSPPKGFDKVKRSAKQCADIFTIETAASGTYVFQSLTGYHVTDADKGLNAIRELVDLVMPVKQMPVGVRIKNGVPFKGPFLDELLEYVGRSGESNVKNSKLTESDKRIGVAFAAELQRVLLRGMQMANTFLNESEAEMKSPDPSSVKHMYDVPNLDVEDAPVPTDLYCLAHTNRVEIDDKQLQASANIGSEIAAPMTEAMGSLKDAVERMTAAQMPASTPANVMTVDQVEEMMAEQERRLTAMFEERMAAAAGAGSEAPTETKTKGGK